MIGFGNFRADDLIQLMALSISLFGVALWSWLLYHSHRPLYFTPAIVACVSIAVFYFVILFVPMETETATMLSAARTLIDVTMWALSAGAMIIVRHYGGKV